MLNTLSTYLRAILLAMSISGFLCLGAFTFSPKFIDEMDENLIKSYEERVELRFREALALLKEGDGESGVRKLESILVDLGPTKKFDRHARLKRKALRETTKYFTQNNQRKKALAWYDTWISYDDRDLLAQIDRAQLLLENTMDRPKGEEVIHQLAQRAPESWFIAETFIKNLLQQDREAEALLAYHRWGRGNYLSSYKAWSTYWDTGSNFNEKEKRPLEPTWADNQIELQTHLPAKITRLRLDLPPRIPLALENISISIDAHVDKVQLGLQNAKLRTNQIRRSGSTFITTGAIDPYLFFEMPDGAFRKRSITFSFRATVSQPSFSDLFPQETYRKEIVEKAVDILLEEKLLADAVLLYFDWARIQNRPARKAWQIYWDEGQGFNERQKQLSVPTFEGPRPFELQLRLSGRTKRLRIDPPPNTSLKLKAPVILVEKHPANTLFDLWKGRLLLKDVKKLDDLLVISATNDPHFSWTIPPGTLKAGDNTLIFRADLQHEDFPVAILRQLEFPTRALDVTKELRATGRTEVAEALLETSPTDVTPEESGQAYASWRIP